MALGDGSDSLIDDLLSYELLTPWEQVVFDDTFVDLMEDIGGDGLEHIGVREVGPERVVYRTEALSCVLRRGLALAGSS